MSKLFNKKNFNEAKKIIGYYRKEKRKADKIKAGVVGAAGTGVVGLGVLKAKSILDQDTRKNTTSRDVYMQEEKKNKK
tara:strand:- start:293 stop:526 length:234 start_codon:yes stop_codon:yes gene_type:complete